jgi:thiol-disulfide isomerase/thioredoxin
VRPLVLAVLLALLAGCASSTVDGSPPVPSASASCLPPPPSVAIPAPSGPATGRIPDLTLDCVGGGKVRLDALHRPAIVNLWASWCEPCRKELPAFQSYAARAGDRVLVLGVDTGDTRDAGEGLLQDTGVHYPTLVDDGRLLLSGVGRSALPVTLFVDADGGMRYIYNDKALDEPAIVELARTHLGVAP